MKVLSTSLFITGNGTRPAALSDLSPRCGGTGGLNIHREKSLVHLTPRQLDVLAVLCEGLPNKLICRRLNISAGTAKVHINAIYRALGVRGRVQAVVRARQYGIITDEALWQPEAAEASGERVRPDVAGPAPRVSRFDLARLV